MLTEVTATRCAHSPSEYLDRAVKINNGYAASRARWKMGVIVEQEAGELLATASPVIARLIAQQARVRYPDGSTQIADEATNEFWQHLGPTHVRISDEINRGRYSHLWERVLTDSPGWFTAFAPEEVGMRLILPWRYVESKSNDDHIFINPTEYVPHPVNRDPLRVEVTHCGGASSQERSTFATAIVSWAQSMSDRGCGGEGGVRLIEPPTRRGRKLTFAMNFAASGQLTLNWLILHLIKTAYPAPRLSWIVLE